MLLPNVSSMLVSRGGAATARSEITLAERNELADVLAEGAVEAGFQPIVELATAPRRRLGGTRARPARQRA